MIGHYSSLFNLNFSLSHGQGLLVCVTCSTHASPFYFLRFALGMHHSSSLLQSAYVLSTVLSSSVCSAIQHMFFATSLNGAMCSRSMFLRCLSLGVCCHWLKPLFPTSIHFDSAFHRHPACYCFSDSSRHFFDLLSSTFFHTQHHSSSDPAVALKLLRRHCSLLFFLFITCSMRFASIASACALLQTLLFLCVSPFALLNIFKTSVFLLWTTSCHHSSTLSCPPFSISCILLCVACSLAFFACLQTSKLSPAQFLFLYVSFLFHPLSLTKNVRLQQRYRHARDEL